MFKKPNLIPNEPKDGSFSKEDRDALLMKHGGIEEYIILHKKDGCRMEAGAAPTLLTRSLKPIKSALVNIRFNKFQQVCLTLGIVVEGEFYAHGMKFNEIFRFFSKSDVTKPSYIKELTTMMTKKPEAFYEKYRGRDVKFLTTFHESLKFWMFDGVVLDRPDLVGYQERMTEITSRLQSYNLDDLGVVEPAILPITTIKELYEDYNKVIEHGWEGLVLTHKNHPYKNGRSTLKGGTILKLKDDKYEYDGVVIDVEESTIVREGAEKKINELGRSKTSQLKADRLPSGMAKGFVVEFEGRGTFCVGLNGFDHDARREVLKNKENYIGRNFKYSGMPPVKDFPRHAYFDTWRDEK
jgi:hypothetical protein